MIKRILLHIIILLALSTPVAGFAQAVTASIYNGFNVTALPSSLVAAQQTAFPLLTHWKTSGIIAIEAFDASSGKMLRAELNGSGIPAGVDFPLQENSALYTYSSQQGTLALGDNTSCTPLSLSTGFNLASYACFPVGYLASNFISDIGIANITSISRLDINSSRWQTAAVDNSTIVGEDFPLSSGEGYIIQATAVKNGWVPPRITLNPTTLTVWQGQPDAALTVSIPAPAPSGGILIDLSSSDPALVNTAAQVTIPQGSTSISVPLTLPDTGTNLNQSVTVTAFRPGMTDGQTTLSVRPKPTINLSPLTTLTGLTFTYLLTVNLSDVASPGGFPVTLTAAPANIVSIPTSVTIPAGASSTQVTVTAATVGTATITASSPGRGFNGSQNSVTVTPIQTMNYGPVITAPVGVNVTIPPASGNQNVSYGPIISRQVGVVIGSAVSGVTPPTGATGSTSLKVTVIGVGLSTATAITFQPATGITIQAGSFTINASGNPEVIVDIDPTAPTIMRTVLVTLPSGIADPASPGANKFRVTLPEPQILGMQPIRSMVGQIVSMNIFGKNLAQASSIDFTPATGISVSNPPTVNAAGDMATVTLSIAANAPLGNRVVTISTPGWTSSATQTVGNTFSVTADAGTTYTPLVSSEVGVMVAIPPPNNNLNVAYGPLVSSQLGVVVGSALSGVDPPTGATGTTGLKVSLNGVGLSTATEISFQPPTGITIQAGSFTINASGNPEVIIDIDSTAPTLTRTVIVTLPAGIAAPASPGANQFRVTLPEPQILSLQPIRSMVGQTVSMNIFGRNFSSATSINFTPATGISVNNPPTINAAGDMASVTVNIAANAQLGDRIVTITTPGWTSSKTATVGNTFSVTADAGTTYTPLISREVGVIVTPATGSNQVIMNYGPIASTEVGVMVTPALPPATIDVNYGPVVSTQVGIAVGGVLTGLAPLTVEPGSTSTLTLTGIGLNLATAIQIVPATGITIDSWNAAPDGLTATVQLSASAATPVGQKTIVVLTSGGSLTPAGPGTNKLLVGYKPSINSISPILPTVDPLTGANFILTINGTHLQGANRVEILPATHVTIANPPVWSSDGTGEHLTVTVIIDGAAVPGDRVVVVTTPYGVTTSVASPANTITFFKPGVVLLQPQDEERIVVAAASKLDHEPTTIQSEVHEHLATLNSQRAKTGIRSAPRVTDIELSQLLTTEQVQTDITAHLAKRHLYAGYRGPPTILTARNTIIPGGYHA